MVLITERATQLILLKMGPRWERWRSVECGILVQTRERGRLQTQNRPSMGAVIKDEEVKMFTRGITTSKCIRNRKIIVISEVAQRIRVSSKEFSDCLGVHQPRELQKKLSTTWCLIQNATEWMIRSWRTESSLSSTISSILKHTGQYHPPLCNITSLYNWSGRVRLGRLLWVSICWQVVMLPSKP